MRCGNVMLVCSLRVVLMRGVYGGWILHAGVAYGTDSPALNFIHVLEEKAPLDIQRRVQYLVDDGQRVILTGSPGALKKAKPDFVNAWPDTNTIVLDPGATLGVFGFNAVNEDQRRSVVSAWPWIDDTFVVAPGRHRRAAPSWAGRKHVELNLTAPTPSTVCRQFSRKMAASLFADTTPTDVQRRAFRREIRRWCQYGDLSVHVAEPARFTIEPFRTSPDIRLSLMAEWGLIRSEDALDARKTTYLLWTKTVGDGGGMGFTRRHGEDAWYDPYSGAIHGLFDVAIHSGWGPVEHPDVVTAWPLNSSFPHVGNVSVFRCDAPEAFRPAECPFMPLLRKLYPDDSFDGKLTVSEGETIAVGGEAKLGRSSDSDGKVSLSMTLGLHMVRSISKESQLDMSLVHVRSNGDTRSYRSTWWQPDVAAIHRWISARSHKGSLASATPAATTLNPRHEILWELLLAENAGRSFPYHVVYEAGLNFCVNGTWCADYRRPSGAGIPAKARMGWSDGIVVSLPMK